MCLFISIAISENDRPHLRAILSREVRLDPQTNADLQALVHPSDHVFVLSTSGCGCHLFGEPEEEDEAVDRDNRARKYARRGWSPAKIQRALSQADSAHPVERSFTGIRADVREALATAASRTGCLHIFVHDYEGSVDSARITPAGRVAVGLEELRVGTVEIEQNQLYSVVA